jgi:hypothetical protein
MLREKLLFVLQTATWTMLKSGLLDGFLKLRITLIIIAEKYINLIQ